MAWEDAFTALQATPVSELVAESDWIFPTVECLHVISITLVLAAIAVVDLRLIGLASRHRPAWELERQFVPITWTAFACAAATGSVMFMAKPVSYVHNPLFLAKLAAVALAGVNMLAFHWIVMPRARDGQTPAAAKVSGFLSLAIWIGVVALGRWMGFAISP
jgi:uncharacterized membrane protein